MRPGKTSLLTSLLLLALLTQPAASQRPTTEWHGYISACPDYAATVRGTSRTFCIYSHNGKVEVPLKFHFSMLLCHSMQADFAVLSYDVLFLAAYDLRLTTTRRVWVFASYPTTLNVPGFTKQIAWGTEYRQLVSPANLAPGESVSAVNRAGTMGPTPPSNWLSTRNIEETSNADAMCMKIQEPDPHESWWRENFLIKWVSTE